MNWIPGRDIYAKENSTTDNAARHVRDHSRLPVEFGSPNHHRATGKRRRNPNDQLRTSSGTTRWHAGVGRRHLAIHFITGQSTRFADCFLLRRLLSNYAPTHAISSLPLVCAGFLWQSRPGCLSRKKASFFRARATRQSGVSSLDIYCLSLSVRLFGCFKYCNLHLGAVLDRAGGASHRDRVVLRLR